MRRNSASADCCRINAPEGKLLQVEDLLAQGVIAEPLEVYSLQNVACTLSHRQLWQVAIVTAAPVTIAEDDAVLNCRFSEKSTRTLAKLPPDWDVILWGWNFDSILHCEVIEGLKQVVMNFDLAPLREKLDQFQAIDVDPMPLRLFGAFGLLCYSVSPKGATLLRNNCFPLRNEVIPIPGLGRQLKNFGLDVVMNKYYRVLKAFVAFPPLAWSENDKTTSSLFPTAAGS